MGHMANEMVPVQQQWPLALKRGMFALARRQGVSVSELTRQALEAQYAAELGIDMPETVIESATTWKGELR